MPTPKDVTVLENDQQLRDFLLALEEAHNSAALARNEARAARDDAEQKVKDIAAIGGVDDTVQTTGDLPASNGDDSVFYVLDETQYYQDTGSGSVAGGWEEVGQNISLNATEIGHIVAIPQNAESEVYITGNYSSVEDAIQSAVNYTDANGGGPVSLSESIIPYDETALTVPDGTYLTRPDRPQVYDVQDITDLRTLSTNGAAAARIREPTERAGVFQPFDSDPIGDGDNGATTLEGAPGEWWARREAVMKNKYKAEWWGVSEGATASQNASRLQEAVDFVQANPDIRGGTVLLPAATLEISAQIILHTNVRLVGQGAVPPRQPDFNDSQGTKLVWRGGALGDDGAIVVGGNADATGGSQQNAIGVQLHNFGVDLLDAKGNGQDLHGVLIDGSDTRNPDRGFARDIRCHSVAVRGSQRNGFYLNGNAFGIKLHQPGAAGCKRGIYTQGASSVGGQDSPGQIYCYEPQVQVGSQFPDAVGMGWAKGAIYGGNVGAGSLRDGTFTIMELYSSGQVWGTRIEGKRDGTSSTKAIVVAGQNVKLFPGVTGATNIGIQLGDGSGSRTDQCVGRATLNKCDTGLKALAGESRRCRLDLNYRQVDTNVDDQRAAQNGAGHEVRTTPLSKTARTKDYLIPPDVSLAWGKAAVRARMQLDSTEDNLSILTQTSGGGRRDRIRFPVGVDRGEMIVRRDDFVINRRMEIRRANRETLAGDKTLSEISAQRHNLDPGGAARNVDLPAASDGVQFWIGRRDGSTNNIAIRDSGGNTLYTLGSAGESAVCVSDGTGWMIRPGTGVVT